MTKDQAIKWAGTQAKLGAALGVSQGTVAGWGDFPPALRQLQLEALSGGALIAESECDKYRVPAAPERLPESAAQQAA